MNATILVVDHHEGSLEILRRDIARRYGADYEVIPASSTADAIAVQKDLVSEGRSIALVIAYQWMTGMTGIELLSGCRAFHPGAMRALMIDVGDLPAEEPIVRALTLNHIELLLWETVGVPGRGAVSDYRRRASGVVERPPAKAREGQAGRRPQFEPDESRVPRNGAEQRWLRRLCPRLPRNLGPDARERPPS